jgi:hypothetical protein
MFVRPIHQRYPTGQLGAAVSQVDEAGTAAQRSRAAELLAETRRSVYRLLADDDPTAS